MRSLSASQHLALVGVSEKNPLKGCNGMSQHGGRRATLWSLTKLGLILRGPSGELEITEKGRALLQPPEEVINNHTHPNPKRQTDEELFDAIREEVNRSRNYGSHNRPRLRAISAECERRGWTRKGKGTNALNNAAPTLTHAQTEALALIGQQWQSVPMRIKSVTLLSLKSRGLIEGRTKPGVDIARRLRVGAPTGYNHCYEWRRLPKLLT